MRLATKLLIALLSVGLLPSSILAALQYRLSSEAILEARRAHLETVADKKVEEIERFLDRARATATVGQYVLNARKNMPVVSRGRHGPDDDEYRSAVRELDSEFRPFVRTRPEILDVLFLSEGHVVYSANPDRVHRRGDSLPEPYARVVADAADGVRHSRPFRHHDRSTMIVAAPVKVGHHLAGIIAFEIDLESLLARLRDRTGLEGTGETLLARREADTIVFLHRRRADPSGAQPSPLPFGGATALPMQRALRHERGSGVSTDYRGTEVIAAWRPVPEIDGGLVAKIDLAEAFEPVGRLRNTVIGLVAAMIVLLVVAAVWLARGIAKPILVVRDAARRVAAGELTHRIAGPQTRDETGQLSLAFDTMTERLQATMASRDELQAREAELRTSEEKLRVLFEESTDLIALTDVAATPLMVNPAWKAVFGPDPNAEANPFERIHPDDVERVALAWARLVEQDEPLTGLEYRYEIGEGFRHLESSAFPVRVSGETRYYVVARDVTERALAAEETSLAKKAAEAHSRELEAFAYSVSHDLRAPLRSMDGFSRLLLESHSDQLDAKAKHYLERIRVGATTMGDLIDGILGLSRISRASLIWEDFDLAALARKAAASLQENAPERRVELLIPERLPANGDPRLVASVVQNLLGNSWKFSAKAPVARIEVGVTRDGEFFVRDNGVGFDMGYAGKLFGVFQRLHSSAEYEGTGIGLATAQRIVHRHGGRIWADSAVGCGATFYFTLRDEDAPRRERQKAGG